jgi:hypothetical protein
VAPQRGQERVTVRRARDRRSARGGRDHHRVACPRLPPAYYRTNSITMNQCGATARRACGSRLRVPFASDCPISCSPMSRSLDPASAWAQPISRRRRFARQMSRRPPESSTAAAFIPKTLCSPQRCWGCSLCSSSSSLANRPTIPSGLGAGRRGSSRRCRGRGRRVCRVYRAR